MISPSGFVVGGVKTTHKRCFVYTDIVAGVIEHFRRTKPAGSFDEELPKILASNTPDFVFFDGNHRKDPTLRYFNWCLDKATDDSIFIFDDIHWSDDMESAWDDIKSHKRVTVTIDLFEMGIVFFKKKQAKQHFIVRF